MAKDKSATLEQFGTFGETLKFLRRRARLTQLELSIAVGYSEAQVSRLETGQRLPELAAVAALFIPALRLDADTPAAARLMQLAAEAREPAAPGETERVVVDQISEASQELPPTNLPYPLDRFIGRHVEVSELKSALATQRLVTLVGAGGVGKTRLATELGWQLLETYADGVCIVQAAPLRTASEVPVALAANLQVHQTGDQSLDASLQLFLRSKSLLIILDNAEHLIPDVTAFLRSLLEVSPGLVVLVTSRGPLHMGGEQVVRLEPLRSGGQASPDAVQLFVERARSAAPKLRFDAAALAIVQRVCTRLDGLPLAIELAAARLGSMSLEQLSRRLETDLSLLAQSGADQRHQTMERVVDWSYASLSPAEQKLLCKLSVFAGGWTAEAAEKVTGTSKGTAVIDQLAELVDKSLVELEKSPEGIRYQLLESVRGFAAARLGNQKQRQVVQRKHALYYLGLVERLNEEILGSQRRAWLQRIDAERANLVAALAYVRKNDQVLWWKLAGNYGWYWHARGLIAEAMSELEPLLKQLGKKSSSKIPVALRAKVAWAGGLFYWVRGELSEATRRLTQSIALWRRAGKKHGLAEALRDAAVVSTAAGDLKAARHYNRESLQLWRKLHSPGDLALAIYNNGYALEAGGDASAEIQFEEAVALARQHELEWVLSVALQGLGRVAARNGKLRRAQNFLKEAQVLFQADRDPWSESECLALLGEATALSGHVRQAAHIFLRCVELNSEIGDRGLDDIALHGLGRIAQQLDRREAALQLMNAAVVARATGASGDPRAITRSADRQADYEALQAANHSVSLSALTPAETLQLARSLAL